MLGKIFFNMLSSTLEEILEKTFVRLIGQNSVIFWGFTVLGIKYILVSLRLLSIVLKFRILSIN